MGSRTLCDELSSPEGVISVVPLSLYLSHSPHPSHYLSRPTTSMEAAPNQFLTHFVMANLWTALQAERFICSHDPLMWRVSLGELRGSLGRVHCSAAVYRYKLTLVATALYAAGHQRSSRDIIHNVMSESRVPLPSIQQNRPWWTAEELAIAHTVI
jgi:hypothetical protein